MRNTQRLLKLAAMLLCGAVILGPGDRSWGEEGFYVVGAGSPWKRDGNNIYYDKGYVGIGTTTPSYPLHIKSDSPFTVLAVASSSGAAAIYGFSSATSGNSRGVMGISMSPDARAYGVLGSATGAGSGVYGTNHSLSGYGIQGINNADGPDIGLDTGGIAIYGSSSGNGGVGVYGIASNRRGTGVHAYASGSAGCAIYGEAVGDQSSGGMFSTTGNFSHAILATSYSEDSYAGSFFGAVNVHGNFAVSGGSKTAIVPTSQGHRKLYCQESPEVWFEDFGEGQLQGGLARIDLDPLFLETVTIDEKNPMKVFIQLNDDCHGVYVQRMATGFEVKELRTGASSAHFTYRVIAKRKGFETARLESAADHVKVAALKDTKK
jgi:hypothetical protein